MHVNFRGTPSVIWSGYHAGTSYTYTFTQDVNSGIIATISGISTSIPYSDKGAGIYTFTNAKMGNTITFSGRNVSGDPFQTAHIIKLN